MSVEPYFIPGLLRINPQELCDPRFAELNERIAKEERAAPRPYGEAKEERMQEAIARMKAKSFRTSSKRRESAKLGWKRHRNASVAEVVETEACA